MSLGTLKACRLHEPVPALKLWAGYFTRQAERGNANHSSQSDFQVLSGTGFWAGLSEVIGAPEVQWCGATLLS